MRITLAGVHMELGEGLKEHAQERLQDLKKYFDQVMDVSVGFVKEPHHANLHLADVTVHASGLTLRAEGQGIDWYAALDDSVAKLGKQLEKYKGRLEKHRERRKKNDGKMKEFAAIDFEEAAVTDEALDGLAAAFSEFAPDIVKKEVSKIAPMSVDEAVMQMDLLHKPAFLFMNAHSGQLNMVYREENNTVRWVAPRR